MKKPIPPDTKPITKRPPTPEEEDDEEEEEMEEEEEDDDEFMTETVRQKEDAGKRTAMSVVSNDAQKKLAEAIN